MNIKKYEREVDKMIKNWDKVECHSCGKEVSMFNSKLITRFGDEYFYCMECFIDEGFDEEE